MRCMLQRLLVSVWSIGVKDLSDCVNWGGGVEVGGNRAVSKTRPLPVDNPSDRKSGAVPAITAMIQMCLEDEHCGIAPMGRSYRGFDLR